jgi:hypothetical protein
VVAVVGGVSLASWGFAPTAARSPKPPGSQALTALTVACTDALRARLSSRQPLTLVGPPRVEAVGGGGYRLRSSFDAGGARTAFACDADEAGGTYEVAALTLVQW